MRFVITLITGAATGALAGGGLVLITSWVFFPPDPNTPLRANWALFSGLLGAMVGSVPGLLVGLAAGLTHAPPPTAALIGLVTGCLVSIALLVLVAAWEEPLSRVWVFMAPPVYILVGLCASAVGSYRS